MWAVSRPSYVSPPASSFLRVLAGALAVDGRLEEECAAANFADALQVRCVAAALLDDSSAERRAADRCPGDCWGAAATLPDDCSVAWTCGRAAQVAPPIDCSAEVGWVPAGLEADCSAPTNSVERGDPYLVDCSEMVARTPDDYSVV